MGRCRCYDIQVAERDLGKLDEMGGIVSRMESALSATDEAASRLKSAVSSAVDISMGGVPSDAFSRGARSELSSATRSISSRRSQLQEELSSFRREDVQYHEEVRLAAIRAAEARRWAQQQGMQNGYYGQGYQSWQGGWWW